ncbi:17091_t:CDS:1 [Racocetra persica]|uniref:17091_t:CDS:1 n=1 Tax=Racocetra persica TaxID=160502 RepID=A0ACA9RQQ1_9GLOM|nr:17091_t:CDS:1 [Racocetra persica]
MGWLNSRNKQLRSAKNLRKYEQREKLLDHLISVFKKLDDNDFIYIIKKIFESREINTCVHAKRNEMLIHVFDLPDSQVRNASALFQTMLYSQGNHKGEIVSTYLQNKACEFIDISLYKNNHNIAINALKLKNKNLRQENRRLKRYKSSFTTRSLSVRIARAKQFKRKQISKIRSSIRKSKKIHLIQFQQAVTKLFKFNNNEYNARFVKLATDISTIGRTSIRATVKCTKAIYQFLTGKMPKYWIIAKTLARWNNEIASLSFIQNHPIETSRFFGYGVMVDEST